MSAPNSDCSQTYPQIDSVLNSTYNSVVSAITQNSKLLSRIPFHRSKLPVPKSLNCNYIANMSNILNATDPGHIASDTDLQSPTSANAVTRAQAAAQNTSNQSDPNIAQQEPIAPQMPGPSSTTNEEEIDYDLYRQLTEEEAPSDQQWLQSTEELEKAIKGMLGANFLAASTTADPTLREVRDCVEQKDWERLKSFDKTYWALRDSLHNRNGVLCYDEKVVIPTKLRPQLIQIFHAAHPGQLGMLDVSASAWWPKKNRQLIHKAQKCFHWNLN